MSAETFLGVSGSELKDQFGLPLFKNEVGQQLRTQVDKAMALYYPLVDVSFVYPVFLEDRAFVFLGFVIHVGKMLLNPIKKFFSRVRDIKNRSKVGVFVSVVFGGIHSVNAERTLSIDDTSKIGQFEGIINNFFVFDNWHSQAPCV